MFSRLHLFQVRRPAKFGHWTTAIGAMIAP
jgi:hypothetical protein